MAERESVRLWDTTAANNDDIDPAVNFAEGQLPGTLNNSNRAAMAAVARDFKDRNGSLTSTGSANAYALTINNTWTALATGQQVSFKANFANTGAATITVTNADAASLGSKAIRVISVLGDSALSAGQIIANGHYNLRYDAAANSAAGAWILLNPSFTGAGGSPREALTANRNYYVRTDGSDSNTGLVNSAGGAFLTVQKAVDVLWETIDRAGYDVAINVVAGTYVGQIAFNGPSIGGGIVYLRGDTTTPTNVVLETTGASQTTVDVYNGAVVTVQGFKLKTSSTGTCLTVQNDAIVSSDNLAFEGNTHVFTSRGHFVYSGNYATAGNFGAHMHVTNNSFVRISSGTGTIAGTPAVSSFFFGTSEGSVTVFDTFTYSGSATGKRFVIHGSSKVVTSSGTLDANTFFPGNSNGELDGDGAYNGFYGAVTISGILAISDTTASSSASTGALTVAGGVGVLGKINCTLGVGFPTNSAVIAGPSATRVSDLLVLSGGTAGYQFNNQANSAARSNMTDAGAWKWGAYGAGALSSDGSGNITASDERLKNIKGPYTDGLEALMRIEPIRFSFKTTPDIDTVGLSAQNIETVIPEAIGSIPLTQDHLNAGVECEGDRAKNLDDRALIALLINAVKELSRKVGVLEARVNG